MKTDPKARGGESLRGWGSAASFGMNFVAYVVVFTLGGHFADRRLDTGHLFLLTGLVLGFVGGAYEAWKLIRSLDAKTTHKNDDKTDRIQG